MSWKDKAIKLYKRFRAPTKFAAKMILGAVVPGGPAVVQFVGEVIDCVYETTKDNLAIEEKRLPTATQADWQRVEEILDLLAGEVAPLMEQVAKLDGLEEKATETIRLALATDAHCRDALRRLDHLARRFDRLEEQNKKLLQGQGYAAGMLEEMLPLMRRMSGVADYIDDLCQAGVSAADFRSCLHEFQDAARAFREGHIAQATTYFQKAAQSQPQSAAAAVALAGVKAADQDFLAAEKSIARAARLRPEDAELAELHRRVTVASRGATPREQSAASDTWRQAPKVGHTLDGWKLDLLLGHGGWGRVFKASRDGEVRALKVMHPELSRDWQFVERFKKEIETLIKLPRHANLVRIEGFGFCMAQQTWYLTMEYVDGPTLEQYLTAKGPLSEAHIRKVFPDTIDGLAKAHTDGIVHRDIKPGNLIFRKSDQRLVLVDFGLAVGVEDFGQTKVGGISVQFAAPEQHYGKRATQASDVFSLCAVIHYALHYDKPDQRTPDGFSPDLAPPSLRDALIGGMKYNVGQRLRDAGQLLRALVPVAKAVEGAKPSSSTTGPATDYTRGKIGDIIEVPLTASLKMKFAWVPPGTSWLGGGDGKPGQQQFTLPNGLWCGVYPVTQAEWQAVVGDNPSHFKDNPRHPVESVTWDRVQKEFLKILNDKPHVSGLLYRLPTEEEWEYICRGGPISQEHSKYHFYFAKSKTDLTPAPTNDLSSSQANFDGNYPAGSAPKGRYREATSEVGLYLPNPLGIYDLHGNVWEWTSTQGGSLRVLRGGSWNYHGVHCTASYCFRLGPAYANDYLGFRLLAVPVG
jgi:formylglycine-generating enzyme required for sulfatase activity